MRVVAQRLDLVGQVKCVEQNSLIACISPNIDELPKVTVDIGRVTRRSEVFRRRLPQAREVFFSCYQDNSLLASKSMAVSVPSGHLGLG